MTVQDTPTRCGMHRRIATRRHRAGEARGASRRAACRCRRTGRPGRIVATQVGILVGIIALVGDRRARRLDRRLLLVAAERDLHDARCIFFTEGDAWTDISFTFRSTIFGFLIGTTAGSLLGLSFWWSRNYAAIVQPYIICFESIPKLALAPLIILVFGIGLDLQGRDRHRADARGFDADHLCRRQGARSRRREAVLFARRHALAGVPQARGAVLPAVDHLGAAGQHRPGADRRDRRRVHRLAARPRPHHPLRRPDLRHRARLGRGARALDAGRSSCTRPCRGSKSVLRKGIRQ